MNLWLVKGKDVFRKCVTYLMVTSVLLSAALLRAETVGAGPSGVARDPQVESVNLAQTFAIGVILASVLLCLGLGIGVALGRRTVSTSASNVHDFQKLTQMFGGLRQWTDGVVREVSDFKSFVDQVTDGAENEKLRSANDLLQQNLKEAQEALETRAHEAAAYLAEARTDALTKLPNRRVFDEELDRRFAELRRGGSAFSMLLVDIDYFKQFNDRYGHLAGDSVLKHVAETIRKTLRSSDLVTRFGGEEFALLLPGSEEPFARQAAERVRQAVCADRFECEGKQLSVTISCGAAQAILGEGVAALIQRSDQALYASKEAGRNASHWHDGKRCHLIGKAAEPSTSSHFADSATRDTMTETRDFEEVRATLRQRLFQIVDSEPL